MSINRDALTAVVDQVRRSILPPLRTTAVSVRTRTWSGAIVGDGTSSDSDAALPSYVKVRELTQAEVASSGGKFEMGDIKIGPMTPPYTSSGGGGVPLSVIDPDANAPNVETLYVLSGRINGLYRRRNDTRSRPFRTEIIARRVHQTP